ncbi:hypothetical protein ACIBBD_13395 [Streptomyces sp. NPDC051315]|uniref:hypothetical protein n=1 Tax=Streptomyces sp. NPDC051315 TaxID=3365650 RepID=UPI0037B3F989
MQLTHDQAHPLVPNGADARRPVCPLQRGRREPVRAAGRSLTPRTPPDPQPEPRSAIRQAPVVDTPVPYRPRPSVPRSAPEADVMRIVSDSRTAVFVMQYADGRRRYSYWRPVDSETGRGGCYVALPTDVCEQLRVTGRITLGEPVTDPSKTTFRVRPARTPAASAWPARERRRAA